MARRSHTMTPATAATAADDEGTRASRRAGGAGSSHLEVDAVTVTYPSPAGPVTAVDGMSLRADAGDVVAVLGPSGCGKSTLLRAIAGLEPITSGRIRLAGRDLDGIRPDHRDVGLAFQDHVLFPHRTVSENVAFGPRVRGWAQERTSARVSEVLELVGLHGFEGRMPAELSGGEQQRVALARTIAARPTLLMLDEPLGALDRALRDRLLADLPGVFADLDATVLYVTHDHDEALTLADKVAIMSAGRLLQLATPQQLWRAPVSAAVARFLGLDQLLDGMVRGDVVTTALGSFPADGVADGAATLLVLPDAVRLIAADEVGAPREDGAHAPDQAESHELVVEGTVSARRFSGDRVVADVLVDTRGEPISLSVTTRPMRAPGRGSRCMLAVDRRLVRVLPPETA